MPPPAQSFLGVPHLATQTMHVYCKGGTYRGMCSLEGLIEGHV